MITANEIKTDGRGSPKTLEQLLSDWQAALVKQKDCLDKHAAAMKQLDQAIIQLGATLEKKRESEPRKSSPVVDNLIRLFVEYEINPQFYFEKLQRARQQTTRASRDIMVTLPRSR